MIGNKRLEKEMTADWGDHLDVRFYLARRLKKLHGKKVLDLGCGPGFILSQVPDSNEKYGVDINSRRIAATRRLNPRAVLKRASMYSLPFEKGFFDVVIMSNVIPNVDFYSKGNRVKNQLKAFSEVARVLKKGGVLYLTAPNHAWFKKINIHKIEHADLARLLEPYFAFELKGWNPFPPYPRFLPARVLKSLPFWFKFLEKLCENGSFSRTSKFFYTEAVRK